jgi:hypothetical protein
MIEAKKAAAAKIERNLDKLKIEIATLEKARAEWIATQGAQPARRTREAARPNGGPPAGKRRGRSLSTRWKNVLARIGRKGELGASIDDIDAFRTAEGITLERATLRAQLSNYVSKHGYLIRAATGVFTLTPKGAQIAGVKMDTGESRETAGAPR